MGPVVPDDKTITGLGRRELIALVRALEAEVKRLRDSHLEIQAQLGDESEIADPPAHALCLVHDAKAKIAALEAELQTLKNTKTRDGW